MGYRHWGSGGVLKRGLTGVPYPETHLAFGHKLSSYFRGLRAPRPPYLGSLSSNNRQLELESLPQLPLGHLPCLVPAYTATLLPGFSPGSCFLPVLSVMRLNARLCVHPLWFQSPDSRFDQLPPGPLSPDTPCPIPSTHPSPTRLPPTNLTTYLLFPCSHACPHL